MIICLQALKNYNSELVICLEALRNQNSELVICFEAVFFRERNLRHGRTQKLHIIYVFRSAASERRTDSMNDLRNWTYLYLQVRGFGERYLRHGRTQKRDLMSLGPWLRREELRHGGIQHQNILRARTQEREEDMNKPTIYAHLRVKCQLKREENMDIS